MTPEKQFESLILPEHQPIINLIRQHRGSIFGGYIRDTIAGDKIKDLDMAIHSELFSSFADNLTNMGYEINASSEPTTAKKMGELSIEIIVLDERDRECIPGPMCDPDFDVNGLIYFWDHCLYHLGCWYNTAIDPQSIIKQIKNKTAVKIVANEDRYKKIKQKGYTIIDLSDEDVNQILN